MTPEKIITAFENAIQDLKELPKYWVLVIGNNRNEDLNGKPLPPIDAERGVWHGMLVYPSEGQALRAAEHYNKLYDRKCYPVLLGNEEAPQPC